MKKIATVSALVVALISLGLSGFLVWERTQSDLSGKSFAEGKGSGTEDLAVSMAELKAQLIDFSSELYDLRRQVGDFSNPENGESSGSSQGGSSQGGSSQGGSSQGGSSQGGSSQGGDGPASRPVASIHDRIGELESSLASLQSNYEGLSIEGASEERAKIFASAEGAIKADEYFEAGKYSIAAEGYLTYYRNHPGESDSRGVLERARRSYTKAGYSDMAIWVQEEMMGIFPENRPQDLATLAEMEKDAGLYDKAIEHIAEAADLMPETQSRLWQRMYWAWYNQLRDGNEAGLEAYRQVQREIKDAGFTEGKLPDRVNEKIEEILRNRNRKAPAPKVSRKVVSSK